MDEAERDVIYKTYEAVQQAMALMDVQIELLRALVRQLGTVRQERETGGAMEQVEALAQGEPPREELGTWLLTDENVEQIERAILEEQRVRGKAYGG